MHNTKKGVELPMMYRVFDNEINSYVDGFYTAQDGSVYYMKKRFFVFDKLVPVYDVRVDEERFVIQYSTGRFDKNGNMIYEGDICKLYDVEDDECYVIVSYDETVCMFCCFDVNNEKFYLINNEMVVDKIEVVGNVCEDEYPIKEEVVSDGGEDS